MSRGVRKRLRWSVHGRYRTRRLLLAITSIALSLTFSDCGNEDQAHDDPPGTRLFAKHNCVLCHGENGEGKTTGPPLSGLREHYSKQQLLEFLRNPESYARHDDRLRRQLEGYVAMMPGYGYLDSLELEQLADHVLSFE